MNIVHIYWGLSYGGIETMLINIINKQVEAGAHVSMMLINDLYAEELIARLNPAVDVINIGRRPGSRSLSFIGKINRQLDIARPDIIHLHHTATSNFISRRWRPRMCCTVHDIPHGKKGWSNRWINLCQWMLRPRLNNVRAIQLIPRIFAISGSVARGLSDMYGIPSTIVYNGITTDIFKRRSAAMPSGGIFRIVQVSRLDHIKKGQDILLEAIHRLQSQGIDNIDVTFIGEGDSLSILQDMTEKFGLKDRIHFTGVKPQSHIAEHLCDFDLFVQPSRKEGFGLTVAEAMASAVPVLVSAGQGPAEITQGDTFGYTFANGDAADLADKIRHIRDNYQQALRKAGKACREVADRYSVTATANAYLGHYNSIINCLNEKN